MIKITQCIFNLKYIKAFSYSADHNPFLTELTGEEVLQIIGTLRRIRQDTLDEYIASIGDNFGMTIEMEQPIKEYSFVLVKKLCMAAALLGNFQVCNAVVSIILWTCSNSEIYNFAIKFAILFLGSAAGQPYASPGSEIQKIHNRENKRPDGERMYYYLGFSWVCFLILLL